MQYVRHGFHLVFLPAGFDVAGNEFEMSMVALAAFPFFVLRYLEDNELG